MAILAMLKFKTATTEQYDQVLAKMQLGDHTAPGGVFHVCAEDGQGGLQMADTWESAEEFKAFADTQIGPITAEMGMGTPEVTVLPVHNYLEHA